MDNHVINHWRKFIDDEYADEHLECEVQVFGKLADDRYINRGSVTYDEIYHENLDQEYYDMMKNKLGDYKVSLYSREFIGIDKQCDEKTLVTRELIYAFLLVTLSFLSFGCVVIETIPNINI